jgi:pyruvate dehydrogenase E2 component (dihydrolipoamide acetyltransferase)
MSAAPNNLSPRIFASPLAKRIAAQKGVDLKLIAGTGPGGRIVKNDVEHANPPLRASAGEVSAQRTEGVAAAPTPAPKPAEPAAAAAAPDARLYFAKDLYTEITHDNMRKSIAKRLTASKRDIPHYYLTVDCELDELMKQRAILNAKSPKDGAGAFKLSVNDFIVKACAMALIRVPEVNSSWTETALLRHKHADVGVAVALDFGLITPIVAKAETKGLAEISREVKDLADRAKGKKLKPSEFEGGTFAISNLGMMGVRDFTAVINPPHAAILAVGAGEQRVVVKNGAVAQALVMTVRLSCDHRVFDGATGARWLQAFKGFIEDPLTMML